MLIAHKVALKPTEAVETGFKQASGCKRFAYNWALAEWEEWYNVGGQPCESELRRYLNSFKDDAFPWMKDSSKNVIQQAIKNVGKAFQGFFKRLAEYKAEKNPNRKKQLAKKLGYPKFKKKGNCKDSFRADNGVACKPVKSGKVHLVDPDSGKKLYTYSDAIKIDGKYLILPKIGRVIMCERLRFTGLIVGVTISKKTDRWYASITVDIPDATLPRKSHAVVGVDLNVSNTVLSDDREPYKPARPLKKLQKKRTKLARKVGRLFQPGKEQSKNYDRAKAKLAKHEAYIASVRHDNHHKTTTDICRTSSLVVLENLFVKGMMTNHSLANAIVDAAFGEFRRQMEYKAKRYGTTLYFADRWFPSSKKCSFCEIVYCDLELKDRSWICPACGYHHDRDPNASYNLVDLALILFCIVPIYVSFLRREYPVHACGENTVSSDCKSSAYCSETTGEKQEAQTVRSGPIDYTVLHSICSSV